MPSIIVVRLLPARPVEGSIFTSFLNTLSISAYDRTIQNTSPDKFVGANDVFLGTASGVVPLASDLVVQTPTGSAIPQYQSSIVQHFVFPPPTVPPTIPPPPPNPKSVATALIVVNLDLLARKEYPESTAFDVRFALKRGQEPVNIQIGIEYNINNVLHDVDIRTLPVTFSWVRSLQTSAYVYLPAPPSSGNVATIDLGTDGTPPQFATLIKTIDKVLESGDCPSTAPSMKELTVPLTIAQASEIASEIVYDRHSEPPPAPAGALENLYTVPDNGIVVDNDTKKTWDDYRKTFESDLTSYHTTNNAKADRLGPYIYAASAAVWAERQSLSSQMVMISVPVDKNLQSREPDASFSVVLTSSDPSAPLAGQLSPSFGVPAAYFYALGCKFPTSLAPIDRYKSAVTTPAQTTEQALQAAYDAGIIQPKETTITLSGPPAIETELPQAVRRLSALSATYIKGSEARVWLTGSVANLFSRWLKNNSSTSDFYDKFWIPEINSTTHPSDYLNFLLIVITGSNQNFIDAIVALPVTTPEDLLNISDNQWVQLFTTHPEYLPAYTLPGNTARRTAAFLTFLRTLFQSKYSPGQAKDIDGSASSGAGTASDIIWRFVNVYSNMYGQFNFASDLDNGKIDAALSSAFPNEPEVQSWVKDAIATIHALVQLTATASGSNPAVQFSYMEALYSRGFTSAASISSLSEVEFTRALIGTVAYSVASDIWNTAPQIAAALGETESSGFQPVNSGYLVNCVPPEYLSPFGPCQYLSDILGFISESFAQMDFSQRRGRLGALEATGLNAEAQLPLLDLVIENLENLGSSQPGGAVCQTDPHQFSDLGVSLNDIDEVETCLAAVPQHSSPSLTLSQPSVYDALKTCFTNPNLPYGRALDISRTYLKCFGTTRFETMRSFRRDVTEFALTKLPNTAYQPPDDFEKTIWRFPVAFDVSLEYIRMSKEEYSIVFSGSFPLGQVASLYGFQVEEGDSDWIDEVLRVPKFLKSTGLTYCEFLDLWKSGFLSFGRAGSERGDHQSPTDFPDCLPCCPDDLVIQFTGDYRLDVQLTNLMIFIRFWRKLHYECCREDLPFTCLADICKVLGFEGSGTLSPNFVCQLSSLLMLVDYFHLPWGHDATVLESGPERTKILALWSGNPSEATPEWSWVIKHLLHSVARFATLSYACKPREARFTKLLEENLLPLSRLMGFTDYFPWYSQPTSTIRFVEVLSKIYASSFTVGELLFLFTNQDHVDGDNPFPITEESESLDNPLNWPEDDALGLWCLRDKLVDVCICDTELSNWNWERIVSSMQHLGLIPHHNVGQLRELAEHSFPDMFECLGHRVSLNERRWATPLSEKSTTATLWSAEPCEPFHYEPGRSGEESDRQGHDGILWVKLPLTDEDVFHKLRRCRQLGSAEIRAVQNLYFAPRAMLAPFALIFSNFNEAVSYLVQECDEVKRFEYFKNQFAIFYKRCHIVAGHLALHVGLASGCCEAESPDKEVALRVLRSLIADENFAREDWEDDSGRLPSDFEWDHLLSGNAFAALLGLVGTGLLGEYGRGDSSGYSSPWAELRGGMTAFEHEQNRWNSPVPTIIPSLSYSPQDSERQLSIFKNGFVLRDINGEAVSGAESFFVVWKGLLLVECGGHYKFEAGLPCLAAEDESSNTQEKGWAVSIERGQKKWTLLNHCEAGEPAPDYLSLPICLHRGAYYVTIKFRQRVPPAREHDEGLRRIITGFELRYEGPDTGNDMQVVPFRRLIQNWKIRGLREPPTESASHDDEPILSTASATKFLDLHYFSTARDIRRTYQRAFKAMLLVHRFKLSARMIECDWQSELGFLLDHSARFQGTSYYLAEGGTKFSSHKAAFDFNLLPVYDPYGSEASSVIWDSRMSPSLQRQAALFDWFERLFDYTCMRRRVKEKCHRNLWLLFEEVATQQPTQKTEQLFRHLCVNLGVAKLSLTYFSDPLFTISASDLLDERWPIRVWYSSSWVQGVQKAFYTESIADARPELWVSDDPEAVVDNSSGNKNLVGLVQKGLIQSKQNQKDFKGLKKINDHLRCHAHAALVDYLCGMNRVSLAPIGVSGFVTTTRDLSDLLLQDVEAGLEERASRIQDAVHSVQNLVQRIRLSVEPSYPPDSTFSQTWDCNFSSFEIWQARRRRTVYRENWLHWEKIRELEGCKSFDYLLQELKKGDLTVVERGRPLWWPKIVDVQCDSLVQTRERGTLSQAANTLPEGLTLVDTPMRDGRPSLLAPLSIRTRATQSPPTRQSLALESPAADPGGHAASKQTSSESTLEGSKPDTARTIPAFDQASSGLSSLKSIPLWLQAPIRIGTRFIRVAAAANPPSRPYSGCQQYCAKCQGGDKCDKFSVNEYYFWLQDSRYYREKDIGGRVDDPMKPTYLQGADIGSTSAVDPESDWQDPSKLPDLLQWPSRPMVHLYWSRVRLGTLEPARRSTEGIPVDYQNSQGPVLNFSGRQSNSLFFPVDNTQLIPSGDNGIFRYDIETDSASIISKVPDPTTPADPPTQPEGPGSLIAYPSFIHFDPGLPLFPSSTFEASLAISNMYHSRCCWEEALKWCAMSFDILARDNTWMQCRQLSSISTSSTQSGQIPQVGREIELKQSEGRGQWQRDRPCCPSSPVSDAVAKGRAVLLFYLRILLDWADNLAQRNSLEFFQQALVIYNLADRILGPTPVTTAAHDLIDPPMTIGSFVASPAPLNPQLLRLYDEVADGRGRIQCSINAARLSTGKRHNEPSPWGSHRRFDPTTALSSCEDDISCFSCCQPYRYSVLLQKATERVTMAKNLSQSLLSAYEKGDAELLGSLRATQENQIMSLGLEVSQGQWRAADWDVQGVDRNIENALTRLRYYQRLLSDGLIAGENGYLVNINISLGARAGAQISDALAQTVVLTPDQFVGGAGVYGTPVQIFTLPGGEKQSSSATSAARILNGVADAAHTLSEELNTQASWERRAQEWRNQVDVITLEIQQLKRQLLAAERRRSMALHDLNNRQRQIEHTVEVQDFLRNKLTKHELYLFLQQETAGLYRQAYNLALHTARQAQEAFRYERGDTQRVFLQDISWDSLHEGFLAAEKLELALHTMDSAYLEVNCREYELTKSVSLKTHFPLAFLCLKTTGYCELNIPEWFYDLDYPGHYMRRIKNISISVPCVAGPYTGIHCRAQLINSAIRTCPLIPGPEACCCDEKLKAECGHDPYITRRYSSTEAIATSEGLNDDGLFELNFRDDRYLPFEFSGVVSRWRIELPAENNQWDLDTLADFVIRFNYTAREGGQELRRRASERAQKHIPDNGVRLFDIRHEFQDSWRVFTHRSPGRPPHHEGHTRDAHEYRSSRSHGPHRDFRLQLTRNMFPFLTGNRNPRVRRIHLFIEKDECAEPVSDHIIVTYLPECREFQSRKDENSHCSDGRGNDTKDVVCKATRDCDNMYHGFFDVDITPIGKKVPVQAGRIRLPNCLDGVREAYLVTEYTANGVDKGKHCSC